VAWCLVKSEARKFRIALRDGVNNNGKMHPLKLAEMTSEARRDLFSKYISEENAKQVNALFESKLLLKNQQQGMETWAKRVLGIKPEVKRDIFAKIERLEKVLDPKDDQFYRDLASTRLGVDVTQSEAKNLADMSKIIQERRLKAKEDGTFNTVEERLSYGRAKIGLTNYVKNLKLLAERKTLKEAIKDPVGSIKTIAGSSKAIRASMDNSAIFRQGWKTLWTHPRVWTRNAKQSFKNIWNTFGKDTVMDELNADLISRQNAINGRYKKMQLALGTIEEEFPVSFPEKIPVVSKLYKASENAFTAFVYKQRADIADLYLNIAEASGVDLDQRELRSIGKMVNSLTGRGSLGRAEPAADAFNSIFWSPRKMKADIDTLILHYLDKDFSKFARKQSAINTLRVIMGTAAILAIANAIDDDSVDSDPRSANFGKIKVGNTRFDVSGGMASIVTLVTRLITRSTKSSTTNKVTKLNSGDFFSQTGFDVVVDFLGNKLAPVSAVIKDLLKGEDFNGNEITSLSVLKNLFIPLPIANTFETLRETDHANILLVMMADALGIGTNTYSPQSNWKKSTSKTLLQFKEVVGNKEFEKANETFNKRYNEWVSEVTSTKEYESLSEESKSDLITKGKSEIQSGVLEEYGFKYEKGKETQEYKEEKKVMDQIIKKLKSLKIENPFKIKQAFASDGVKGTARSEEERNRWLEVAAKIREEDPEWYERVIGIEGEKVIFGEILYRGGEGSYYNPKNPAETRPGTDGTGAYGRKIKSGSIAFGNRMYHDELKKGKIIYVKIKGFEDVKTPYGDGIFRIDDTMHLRYDKPGMFNIDFYAGDMDAARRRKGRFDLEFRAINL